MATTLRIEETPPASYPTITPAPNAAAHFVTAAWQRAESFIGWRWSARSVVFIVEGLGEWMPPLEPATVTESAIWDGAWNAITLQPSPLGGFCLDAARYRFTANVGSASAPPALVAQAVSRLAEYLSAIAQGGGSGASLTGFQIDDLRVERSTTNWAARALQLSGAADMLRPYRKLGAA